jgi:hypothetical protein
MAESTVKVESDLRQSATVQKWLSGLEKHYGPSTTDDEDRRLESLRRFCAFIESTPDEMIQRSFYHKKDSGDLRISIKSRNLMAQKIAEFQDSCEGSAYDKAREGNAVRSFLIHNGVLMQSGVQH